MASGMLPSLPVVVRACKSEQPRKPTTSSSSSPKWWTPLFGFSSDPDYIDSDDFKIKPANNPVRNSKIRFVPGSFTDEKAKQLRRMTNDATSSHGPMYHSAIASRLASDFSDHLGSS